MPCLQNNEHKYCASCKAVCTVATWHSQMMFKPQLSSISIFKIFKPHLRNIEADRAEFMPGLISISITRKEKNSPAAISILLHSQMLLLAAMLLALILVRQKRQHTVDRNLPVGNENDTIPTSWRHLLPAVVLMVQHEVNRILCVSFNEPQIARFKVFR